MCLCQVMTSILCPHYLSSVVIPICGESVRGCDLDPGWIVWIPLRRFNPNKQPSVYGGVTDNG